MAVVNYFQEYGTPGLALTHTSINGLINNGYMAFPTVLNDTANTKYLDILVFLNVVTGATVAGDKAVQLWVAGSVNNGTNFTDNAPTAGGAFTPPDPPNLKYVGIISTPAINTTYRGGPFSIAQAFGGLMSAEWILCVRNLTGASLGTGSGGLYQGVYAASVV
jgi:hypothetical protein